MPPAPDTRCLGGRPVHALGADGQPGEPGPPVSYAVPLPPWPPQRSGSHGMGGEPSMRVMSAPALSGEGARSGLATARPYLLGGVASLSVGAAAIHFAVMFEHFEEYTLYGVFFLVVAWAQMIWAAVVLWRPSRLWLSLGIVGNALILAV